MPADVASSSTDVALVDRRVRPEFFDLLRSAADDAADLAGAGLQAEEESKALARDATLASAIGQAADEARAAALPRATRFEQLAGARARIPHGTADIGDHRHRQRRARR